VCVFFVFRERVRYREGGRGPEGVWVWGLNLIPPPEKWPDCAWACRPSRSLFQNVSL